jgi:hypothetical protein
MRSHLLLCLFASFVMTGASPARADGNLGVERLRRQAAQVGDQAAHPHFIELVGAAERQMVEGDEAASLRAVAAADKADDASAERAPIQAVLPPAPQSAQRDPGPAPRLQGTVIGPSSRIGLFASRDGTLVQVSEGEPIDGYTVQAIRPAEVDVIGGGVVRTLRVGVGGDVPAPVDPAPRPDPGHRQGSGSDQHPE